MSNDGFEAGDWPIDPKGFALTVIAAVLGGVIWGWLFLALGGAEPGSTVVPMILSIIVGAWLGALLWITVMGKRISEYLSSRYGGEGGE